nr:NADH dehydrogenase subunit 5 [Arcotheres sp. GK-2022]
MVWSIYIHKVSMWSLALSSMICGKLGMLKLLSESTNLVEWELLSLNSCSFNFVLIFDWISLMFLCFVFMISASVMYYSGSYMMGDMNYSRFMYLVLMFVMSMMMMILSPNLVSILLGWDGLGLVSYALVIYYQNEKSASAGMLTILSNRVGDVAILLSIGLMLKLGSWNFMFYSYYLMDSNYMLLKLLIMLAAMTKSAQIPFSAWLPAAMAAPTPVSALVHSSTLVTAGVYLMIRFSPALCNSKGQSLLLIIACLTMFMAGVGANFEYDLKKIIALSTLSQLGVMLGVLGLGYPDLAFFHLLSHALFKALLFMCAGVVIHGVGGYQDIRYMGNLVKFMPLTSSYLIVSNLALCGAPFLAGFYSKDMILEVGFMNYSNYFSLILFILATGLTVSYTLRLIFFTMSGAFNTSSLISISDEEVIMTKAMTFLGLGAVAMGSILSWVIYPECYMICLNWWMKNMVLSVSVLGGVSGYMLNLMSMNYVLLSRVMYQLAAFSGSMWFMPFLSTKMIANMNFQVGGYIESVFDKGWYEYIGGQGMFYIWSKVSFNLYLSQYNSIKVFMKMFILSLIIMSLLVLG